jgi:hypothetical protein
MICAFDLMETKELSMPVGEGRVKKLMIFQEQFF